MYAILEINPCLLNHMELSLELQPQDAEELLVEQAIKRDRDAFAALYDRYVDRVYRHVFYRVPRQADAEDITEEVFVRAWKAIDRYRRTGAPFVAWLIRIASNLAMDHYKTAKRFVTLEESETPARSPEADPVTVVEAGFDSDYVRAAVAKLKGDQQRVILMHFIDGFSYAEIALSLGKSEGAIRVIQYRALRNLRQMITRSEKTE
jgi:RNA polymerase sigma-70 factor (ECF subfamily)